MMICCGYQGFVLVMILNVSSRIVLLLGHTAKVFRVKWCPLREGILVSGSDDKLVFLLYFDVRTLFEYEGLIDLHLADWQHTDIDRYSRRVNKVDGVKMCNEYSMQHETASVTSTG